MKFIVKVEGRSYEVEVERAEEALAGEAAAVEAPISGRIVSVPVKVGDAVKPGDPVAVIEASRMMSPGDRPMVGAVHATHAGTVHEVLVRTGDEVKARQPLVRVR